VPSACAPSRQHACPQKMATSAMPQHTVYCSYCQYEWHEPGWLRNRFASQAHQQHAVHQATLLVWFMSSAARTRRRAGPPGRCGSGAAGATRARPAGERTTHKARLACVSNTACGQNGQQGEQGGGSVHWHPTARQRCAQLHTAAALMPQCSSARKCLVSNQPQRPSMLAFNDSCRVAQGSSAAP